MNDEAKNIDRRELLKAAVRRIEELETRLAAAEEQRRAPVAVVGLGCRFPGGADSPEAFWRLLSDGRDAIGEVPADRWKVDDYYDPDPDAPGKMYARGGGFLERVDVFDPQFFGIAPREASHMDPQQRLLLEVTWEALEHAGIPPLGLNGHAGGVFIGLTTDDYSRLQMRGGEARAIDTYFGTGVAASVAAGRLSYVLGLRGPAITVDTACSSSLVAIHLACQSLRAGECRIALSGGVNLMLSPEGHIVASKGRMLSPDSRCKTFDATADGYARSEGCGMVVLKRLSDALGDGDRVLAVIRGTALNQDGRSSGLTAPNGRAQEDVMRAALTEAGIAPSAVGYVETHGTGTSLGDPIEVHALGAVQGSGRPADAPLLVGSVKSNIGHLEAAAGVAGFIKTVLALHHGEIPPHLHFKTPNPFIAWSELPIRVTTERTPWPAGRRIAGISSFGFSGTNAHLVLESAPAEAAPAVQIQRPAHVLALSGRSPEALKASAGQYGALLERVKDAAFADICYTSTAGRSHFEHRLALVADDRRDALAKVRSVIEGNSPPDVFSAEAATKRPPQVAFLFTGQGSQYVNMGRPLYEGEPVFRAALERCEALAAPRLGRSLLSVVYPQPGMEAEAETLVRQTGWTQPALFAVEYALAELWRSWGVEPSAVMGHSIGEIVAATVAGALRLEDAIALVVERGRLMQALPAGGVMAAIAADEPHVAAAIEGAAGRVSVAGINGPAQTVISGDGEAVERVIGEWAARGVRAQKLVVSHAFHSTLMDPMLDEFERAARAIQPGSQQIPVVSNVTGRAIERATDFDAAYWRRHARSAVRFSDSIRTLYELGCRAFVEIGPNPTLIALATPLLSDPSVSWLPSLRRGQSDWLQMLSSIARAHVAGVRVDWTAFHADGRGQKVSLPTYPFQRDRYWVEVPAATPSAPRSKDGHPLVGEPLSSPHLNRVVFESVLAGETQAALKDHQIFGQVVTPAAAYLEMAAAAVSRLRPEKNAVEDLTIHAPMLFGNGSRRVQVSVSDADGEIQIHSRAADETGEWLLHATGRAAAAGSGPVENSWTPVPSDARRVGAREYYDRLARAGVTYGPAFQGLCDVRYVPGQAEGAIEVPEAVVKDQRGYGIHPALLDACFQLFGLALPDSDDRGQPDRVYMPVQVARYAARRSAVSRMHARARVGPGNSAETFVGDVQLLAVDGEPIAEIQGLRFKRATRASLNDAAASREDWLHEIEWQAAPAPESGISPSGRWIVFADAQGCGRALAADLKGSGATPLLVSLGDGFVPPTNGEARVRPGVADDIDAILQAEPGVSGVVHLWGLDPVARQDGAPTDATGARTILSLAQALIRRHSGATLTIVTSGAQSADGAICTPGGVRQSAAWGLGRVIASEHPELRTVLVDLDPAAASAEQSAAILAELRGPRDENQVAVRRTTRLVPRLVRSRHDAHRHHDGPVGLEIRQRGVLDNLELRPVEPTTPAPGEVRIRVEATGLNFRDVLNALGMYPGDPGPLGGEAVGIVDAVGADVTNLRVGDPVLALTPRGFCSFVNTSAKLVVRRPASMSVHEAATIPMTFLTAEYALAEIGRLRAGERVLIHAGAGGVGLAAIQVARLAGAEIFATAGSPEKRELLKSLGVPHVMDSRTLAFADEVMSITRGEGIDIVLNSLAGEFIPRSLSVLREGGRFLELGKTDLWDQARASAVNPKAVYRAVYLGEACSTDPDGVQAMFAHLMDKFSRGGLQPLPWKRFPIERAVDAFRFMAQARHVGKIVIEQAGRASRPLVRPDGAYLVTGAFGGLGVEVARWLAASGARHLALVGRNEPGPRALDMVRALETDGVSVRTVRADVADAGAIGQLVADLAASGTPVRGVIHAAGILDDALVMQQDGSRFDRVMRPKVSGAWNLHCATEGCDLDFFVLFSAGAALFGSAGQGNYAAANAWLDALAWYRRGLGVPALSVNWGAWEGSGMASLVGARDRQRWTDLGLRFIDAEGGLAALATALRRDLTQVAVLPMDWPTFLAQWSATERPAFLRALSAPSASSTGASVGGEAGVVGAIRDAPQEERLALLEQHVREQVALVLGIPAASLRTDRGFAELGMDSLMSVELSNRLKRTLSCSLPATLAFEQPTVAALTVFLAGLLKIEASRQGPVSDDREAAARTQLLEEVNALSDEDAEASLARELDRAGY